MNKKDNDSLWVRVFYSDSDRIEIDKKLKEVYSLLHSDGSNITEPYLNIDAVDYCTFGNSKPFRIKVRNIINDNFTYWYTTFKNCACSRSINYTFISELVK